MEARRAARTAGFVRFITEAAGRTVDRSAISIGSLLRVALVGGVVFAAGCGGAKPPSGPRASERPPQDVAEVAEAGAGDAPVPVPPESLEQQARRYAASVETARGPGQPQPSTVEWPDPGELSLAE